MSDARAFFELTPERVLRAVEAAGLRCTGRCLALNSFENRVYDVELELDDDAEPARPPGANFRVVKFYRPGRWTPAQILEEHAFIRDLREAEIPAVGPVEFPDGGTLRAESESGILYSVFPKQGGRSPDELAPDQLRRIGRLLARMHVVGARRPAPHRLRLDVDTYGRANLEYLLKNSWIPVDFESRYRRAAEAIFAQVEPWFGGVETIRLHGDCHLGNLLWSSDGPYFVDFDDLVIGPPVQDLWLMMPGRDDEARRQWDALLEGYEEMREFDRRSLRLIEPLRSLRLIHYAAWVARRWDDPAFPRAFPEFNSHRYWRDQTEDLEQQLRVIVGQESGE